jgi:hypothetical protein
MASFYCLPAANTGTVTADEIADYRGGSDAELAEKLPAEAERIRALTRS